MLVYFFFLILQHWAGVSLNTSFYKFAETCAFSKQSLSPILCQLKKKFLNKLLLLQKLQSHFAEFLQHNYLKRLNLLNQSTCVGLSTVFIIKLKSYFLKILYNFYFNHKIKIIFIFCHL